MPETDFCVSEESNLLSSAIPDFVNEISPKKWFS